MSSIELLILNEQLVSKLYTIYAEKFPENKDFWLQKAAEENAHAELLEKVQMIAEEIPSFFKDRFSIASIEATITYVNDAIQKAANCSLVDALKMAKRVENSLIEKEFFKVMSGDSIFVQNAFLQIGRETEKHRLEIEILCVKNGLSK